ncbi:hypothetical protein [Lysinibacillus sp. NPDC056185]|uniref:hypothetical protein n=1 Tax=Lysinibacillus sp. NPDC056185 TaxID=3345739 RepID=UPI0039EFF2E3
MIVSEGQLIQSGDPLLKVDFKNVKDNVPSIVTPIVFTSLIGREVTLEKSGFQRAGSNNMISIKK